jgi:lipoprotein-releasing system permease protein
MSYTRFIARRYLQSRRNAAFVSFISGIATLGVTLGTATLIIALSILGGFEREITDKVIGFTSHVQITGFQNLPLKDYQKNAAAIRNAFPSVRSVSPYVSREALIRSHETVDGILLKGLDPQTDNSITPRFIVAGEYLLDRRPGGMPHLVLGQKLAAKLAVTIGDKVTIFAVSRGFDNGQPRVMQFRIVGIYESGMSEYDDVYAFTGLRDAQSLFQMPEAVSGFDIMLTSLDSARSVADGISDVLGYPHFGRTVFENYRHLFSWIELQKKPVPIILGLIIVVATVNIIGTLLMMVLDKTREIGILASMGATRWGITAIFLRQGMTIAFTGTLLGNLLAFGLLVAQLEFRFFSLPSDIYFMTSVPILLQPEYFLVTSVITILLCLLTAFIPARLASKLNPVAAIRFT